MSWEDDWEHDMKKLKVEKTELLDKFSFALNNVNEKNDTDAKDVRLVSEQLIDNAISQSLMYR